MSNHYTERDHDAAISLHGKRYAEMQRTAKEHGRDSEEYRQAREDVLHARKRMSIVAAKR